jgi:signal transduction histidine kinase
LRRPSGTPPDFASATGLGESLPATLANLCSQQAEPHFFRFVPRGEEDEVCLLAGRVSPEGSDAGTLAVGAQWRTPGGRFPEADDRYFFAHLLSDLSLSLTFLAQHKQALEFERVHSLGSITLGMAHDETHLISLVEPLVTQIGEFITKQCVACPRNPGQLARPLGKIRAVAAQVHGIARATLGFARQKGRPQITDCRRDVQTWFANIRDILSDDVLEITHCFDLSDRPFYADGRLVLAALRNLQVNSVASLNRSKHRCYQLDFEATDHPSDGKEPEYAVLRVADSGSGIPEAIAANIFQGRIEDSGTGHGLGTQIVRWVVDQHRALIRFATRPECGTVVELWFPRLDSPNPRKRQWARYETARQRLGVVRRLEHHPWFDHLASIASESMDRPAVEVQ